MTPVLIAAAVLTACLALLAAAVRTWLAGSGRHRAPRRPSPLMAPPGPLGLPDGQCDTDTVLLVLPALPSALHVPHEDRDSAPEEFEGDADRADFDHCPAERRRTPHFLHRDGSRTCCRCRKTTKAGDQ